MDFRFTSEQEAFGLSLKTACGKRLAHLRMQGADGRQHLIHSLMHSLGLFGLMLDTEPEDAQITAVEAMLVSEELGRWNANSEFVESVVLCGELLRVAASSDQRHRWLRLLSQGSLGFSMPLSADGFPNYVNSARFERQGAIYCLNAKRLLVSNLPSCEVLLVPASNSDGSDSHVFGVSRGQTGLSWTTFEALDGTLWAYLDLTDVVVDEADVLRLQDGASDALNHALDAARACLCAESLGAAEVLFSLRRDHLALRKQFGRPLSSNQSLRHKVADMRISIVLMRSITYLAATAVAESAPDRRGHMVSCAKYFVDERARAIAEQAIQLLGAIGMSEECAVGDCARRLLFVGHRLGSGWNHLGRMTALSL